MSKKRCRTIAQCTNYTVVDNNSKLVVTQRGCGALLTSKKALWYRTTTVPTMYRHFQLVSHIERTVSTTTISGSITTITNTATTLIFASDSP